jgi:hypothetical protein
MNHHTDIPFDYPECEKCGEVMDLNILQEFECIKCLKTNLNSKISCTLCNAVIPDQAQHIKMLTQMLARLTITLNQTRFELDDLLQQRKDWFTKSINGSN